MEDDLIPVDGLTLGILASDLSDDERWSDMQLVPGGEEANEAGLLVFRFHSRLLVEVGCRRFPRMTRLLRRDG